MLHVQFNDGTTDRFPISQANWDYYDSMIVWTLYPRSKLETIARILYVSTT